MKYSGFHTYTTVVESGHVGTNFYHLFYLNPASVANSYKLSALFYTKNIGGTYQFYISADDSCYFTIDTIGAVISLPVNSSGSGSVVLGANTYYYIELNYAETGFGGGTLDFAFTPPGLSQTYNSDGFIITSASDFNCDIKLPSLSLPDSYSFMFWIKILSGNNYDEYIFEFKNSGISKTIGLRFNGSSTIAITRNGTIENTSISASIDAWSHYSLVLNNGSAIKLYKNKTQIFTSSFIHDISNSFTATNGKIGLDVDSTGKSLLSKYKDFRVYGLTLTQLMIDNHYDEV